MSEPAEGILPTRVTERLRGYQAQINVLSARRQEYMQGVLDALGIEGEVHIDENKGIWRSVEKSDGLPATSS